jgi:S-adenosylmethionine decarboxylase
MNTNYKKEFDQKKAWGILTSLDIHNCDPDTIRDPKKIKEFVIRLCEKIKMKRFGEPQIINFGEDERVSGYSLTQLIETSLISAHFANLTNNVYLDVFSCKYYDPLEVGDFAIDFFRGDDMNLQVILRK